MDVALFNHRIRVLLLLTGVAICAIAVRLWILQLTQWDRYAREAAGNRTKIVWEPAPRGLVLDRAGRLLIGNRSRWDVEVVPAEFPRKDTATVERIVRRLAEILTVPTPQVRESLEQSLKEQALEAVTLKDIGEDVPFKVVAQVEARKWEMPGIRIGNHVQRFYPRRSLAAHTLGYARAISAEQYADRKDLLYPATDSAQTPPPPLTDNIYDPTSLLGQTGVEALCEDYQVGELTLPLLQGRRGYRLYEVNAGGDPTGSPLADRPACPGATVYLTLDSLLQPTAEEALDEVASSGRAGAAVLVDVNSGELLVLASRPNYDPNKWVKRFTPEEWKALQNDPRDPLLDHATSGCYPPGSVFKLVSATAALSTTNLSTSDHFYCAGVIHQGRDRTPFRCWQRSPGHGSVGFYRGLAESCDVYFYSLVTNRGLSSDSLATYARAFGLGNTTGLGLAGERAGFVPDPRWKRDRRQEPWYTGDTLHMVIGQGYLTTTPLQMALVTAAVANGGFLLKPRLIRRIQWPDWLGYGNQVFTQPEGHRVEVEGKPIEDQVLAEVRRGMRQAVESDLGTAKGLRGLGVSVAGKTGSAQHRLDRPTHAWFVCFAPADKPRYACAVFVAEGGHGSSAAAPIARKILAAAFGVSGTEKPGPVAGD